MTDDIIKALRNGQQYDQDGVRCIVSRQACHEAADIVEASQARIASLELERDGWMVMVGKIAATIPAKDTIGATGTLGDMIEYLKSNQARIAELEAALKTARDYVSDFSSGNIWILGHGGAVLTRFESDMPKADLERINAALKAKP
jgi:hypothetical protein